MQSLEPVSENNENDCGSQSITIPGYSKNGKKLGRKPKVSKALEIDQPHVAPKNTVERILRNRNR